jgi:hypothetical protein
VLLDIHFGSLELRPTGTEQAIAAAGAGAALLGLLGGSRALATMGVLAIAGVGYRVYREGLTFTAPELMNGYFQTGGALSATRGPANAAILAGVLDRRQERPHRLRRAR